MHNFESVLTAILLASALSLAVAPASPAQADRIAADTCAARLSEPARAIYRANVSRVGSGENMADLISRESSALVKQGALAPRDREGAEAGAAQCLKLAGSPNPLDELTLEEYQRMHRNEIEVK